MSSLFKSKASHLSSFSSKHVTHDCIRMHRQGLRAFNLSKKSKGSPLLSSPQSPSRSSSLLLSSSQHMSHGCLRMHRQGLRVLLKRIMFLRASIQIIQGLTALHAHIHHHPFLLRPKRRVAPRRTAAAAAAAAAAAGFCAVVECDGHCHQFPLPI